MLTFITFIDAPEQLEIVADSKGIDELIQYLQQVKLTRDHMHLTIDSELGNALIAGERVGKSISAKQVRIEFMD